MNLAALNDLTDEELIRYADRSNAEVKLLAQRLEARLGNEAGTDYKTLAIQYEEAKRLLTNIGQMLANQTLTARVKLDAIANLHAEAMAPSKRKVVTVATLNQAGE